MTCEHRERTLGTVIIGDLLPSASPHPITPRQMEVLAFICAYRDMHRYSPTMAEIGRHLGVCKVTTFEHVGALVKKDLLTRGEKHSSRTLKPTNEGRSTRRAAGRIVVCLRCGAARWMNATEWQLDVFNFEDFR